MTAPCCPLCKPLAARVDAIEQNQRDSLLVVKWLAIRFGVPPEFFETRVAEPEPVPEPVPEPECGVLIQGRFPVSAS